MAKAYVCTGIFLALANHIHNAHAMTQCCFRTSGIRPRHLRLSDKMNKHIFTMANRWYHLFWLCELPYLSIYVYLLNGGTTLIIAFNFMVKEMWIFIMLASLSIMQVRNHRNISIVCRNNHLMYMLEFNSGMVSWAFINK